MKVTVAIPQLSVHDTLPGLGKGTSSGQLTVRSGGQVITGAELSFIVIAWDINEVLPQASVNLYLRVTVPEHPGLPVSLKCVTVTVPPQLSASPVTRLILGGGILLKHPYGPSGESGLADGGTLSLIKIFC
jgi:hypothetical protein